MNPFEFVIAIIVILSVFRVLRYRMGDRSDSPRDWIRSRGRGFYRFGSSRERDEEVGGETRRLRDEVSQLKERIKVLERITVDKENSLAREIDDLRAPPP